VTRERAAKECSRCGKCWRFGFNWPEGFVCRSCVTRAVKIRGRCAGCGDDRLMVGRDVDDQPVCVDCAGITTCFRCDTCGREAQQWYSRTCVSCSLARRLGGFMDDGTGQVSPVLAPLFEKVTSMDNPISGMTWLNKSAVKERLSSLSLGSTPLTHEGIDTMASGQGREFLRELLVEVELLPHRDKYLAAFESWRLRRLESIADPAIRREIEIYLAWRHSRDLSVRARAGRVPVSAANVARDYTDAAVRFLTFLTERGRTLTELEQQDIDGWFAEASNPTRAVDFLSFAVEQRRCRRVRLPSHKQRSSPGCSLTRLNEIVRHLLEDDTMALSDRVAGLLVVLFAQQVTRVVRLSVDDIADVEGDLFLSLGPDPILVPEPIAALITAYVGARSNVTTTNTSTAYLFPGGRPGEHMTAARMTSRLNCLGITRFERQGSLRHLVSEAPAAVVAKATGYASATTAARSVQSGADWAGYAALMRVRSA
jgi:hypothetical protein